MSDRVKAAARVLHDGDVGECRSEAGITTGLIDAILSVCRVLARRDLTSAREALRDLTADPDFAHIIESAALANVRTLDRSRRALDGDA